MSTETRTPDEIERDIESERRDFAENIDALKERFSPETVVRELSRGLRDHGGEFGSAIRRSVSQNPMALMLTGVGLAWLAFGGGSDEDDYDEDEAYYRRYASLHGGDRDHDPERRARRYSRAGSWTDDPAWRGERHRSGRYGSGGYGSGGYRTGYPNWARQSVDRYSTDDEDERYPRTGYASAGYGSTGYASSRSGASGYEGSGYDPSGGSDDHDGPGMRDRLSEGAHSAAEGARSMAEGARDRGEQMRDRARGAVEHGRDRARDAAHRLAQGTESLSEEARTRVVAARERAVDVAQRAEAAARRAQARGREHAQDFFEDHPLVAGALAMAVGAAIGGALPRTRTEDELLGGTRDDLFDEAERIFEEELHKAQRVAQAAVDEAGTIAEEKRAEADASAPGGQGAAGALADEAREAGERVRDAARHKAEEERLGKPRV